MIVEGLLMSLKSCGTQTFKIHGDWLTKRGKVNNSSEYDKSAKKWVGGVKEPIRMDLIIFLGSGIQVDAKSPRPETRTAK